MPVGDRLPQVTVVGHISTRGESKFLWEPEPVWGEVKADGSRTRKGLWAGGTHADVYGGHGNDVFVFQLSPHSINATYTEKGDLIDHKKDVVSCVAFDRLGWVMRSAFLPDDRVLVVGTMIEDRRNSPGLILRVDEVAPSLRGGKVKHFNDVWYFDSDALADADPQYLWCFDRES